MVSDVLKGLVVDELKRGSDTGEGRSRQQLQEVAGVGAGDLETILADLRLTGTITEQAPDEIVMVDSEEAPDDDDSEDGVAPEPGVSLAEAERGAARRTRETRAIGAIGKGPNRVEFVREATVTMPRAMVDALEADALGKLLKAGIGAADAAQAFVFEVTP